MCCFLGTGKFPKAFLFLFFHNSIHVRYFLLHQRNLIRQKSHKYEIQVAERSKGKFHKDNEIKRYARRV